MVKFILKSAIFGFVMGLIFCILIINMFGSVVTGIILGTCFAIPFFLLGVNLFSKEKNDRNNKK